eukprot:5571110-Pleurochrysis_carterae.AAC.2
MNCPLFTAGNLCELPAFDLVLSPGYKSCFVCAVAYPPSCFTGDYQDGCRALSDDVGTESQAASI